MNDFEFDKIEISKILSCFSKHNVKLSFDDYKDLEQSLYDLVPLYLQARSRHNHTNNYTTKIYELDCNFLRHSGIATTYQYANLQLLNNKDHTDNIKNLHQLLEYFCFFKKMPVVDINGMFGVDLSADGNYINGYYYCVVPYILNDLPPEVQIKIIKNLKMSQKWQEYIASFILNDKILYLQYVNYTKNKILNKLQYSTPVSDIIQMPKMNYVKYDNLIDFLEKENLHDKNYEECGIQVPSNSSTSYDDEYFAIELTPFPYENRRPREEYLEFLSNYFDKLVDYKIINESQKDFILLDEKTKSCKDGILKIRWNNQKNYTIKWYNLEHRQGA